MADVLDEKGQQLLDQQMLSEATDHLLAPAAFAKQIANVAAITQKSILTCHEELSTNDALSADDITEIMAKITGMTRILEMQQSLAAKALKWDDHTRPDPKSTKTLKYPTDLIPFDRTNDLDYWFEENESLLMMNKIPKADWSGSLIKVTSDETRHWVSVNIQRPGLGWDDAKEIFRNHYSRTAKRGKRKHVLNLTTLRQGNMSVTDFRDKLAHLAKLAGVSQDAEWLCSTILYRFKPDIRKMVMSRLRPEEEDDFEIIFDHALFAEGMEADSGYGQLHSGYRQSPAAFARDTGNDRHNHIDDNRRNRDRPNTKPSVDLRPQELRSQTKRSQRTEPHECSYCRDIAKVNYPRYLGHNESECRRKQQVLQPITGSRTTSDPNPQRSPSSGKCWTCGAPDHTSRTCPRGRDSDRYDRKQDKKLRFVGQVKEDTMDPYAEFMANPDGEHYSMRSLRLATPDHQDDSDSCPALNKFWKNRDQ
jgi:hypothetical protein